MRIIAPKWLVCDLSRGLDPRSGRLIVSDTYGAPYPESGVVSQGGYASHIRAHEYFTFPIPDEISTEDAAPMMCAGLTTYSPLLRAGCGPGKKIAILGM